MSTANYNVLIDTLNKKQDEQFDNSVKRIIHNVAYLIHLDEQVRRLETYDYTNPICCIYKEENVAKKRKVALNLCKQLRWLNSQCKTTTGKSFITCFIPENVDEMVCIALAIYSITGEVA